VRNEQSKDRATGALRRDLDALGAALGPMIAADLREIETLQTRENRAGLICQRCGAAANGEMAEVCTPIDGTHVESLLIHAVCMEEEDEIA